MIDREAQPICDSIRGLCLLDLRFRSAEIPGSEAHKIEKIAVAVFPLSQEAHRSGPDELVVPGREE